MGTVFDESLGRWGLGGKHGRRSRRHRDDRKAPEATGGGPGAAMQKQRPAWPAGRDRPTAP